MNWLMSLQLVLVHMLSEWWGLKAYRNPTKDLILCHLIMMTVGCWSIRHTSETTVQHTLLTTYHEHSAVFDLIQPCKLSLYVSC